MKPVLLPIQGRQCSFHQVNDDVILYVQPEENESEAETRSFVNSAIVDGASSFIFDAHELDPYQAVSASGVNGEGWYALLVWNATELKKPNVTTILVDGNPRQKTGITLIELVVGGVVAAVVGFGLWKLFK